MKRDPDIDQNSNNSDPKKYKFGDIYNCEGPYEEFGEDSSGSDMSSESESDDEDLQSLPKQLLEFAQSSDCDLKAENALNKGKAILLTLYPLLASMIEKAKVRTDGKVPPGSSEVKRCYEDQRYLLCSLNIELAKCKQSQQDFNAAKNLYSEALISFPKSIEANFLLGRLYKAIAVSEEDINLAERYFKKAVQSHNILNDTTIKSNPSSEINDPLLVETENMYGSRSLEALILLYCQNKKDEESRKLLIKSGFTHRLSDEVLCYDENLELKLVRENSITRENGHFLLPAKILDRALSSGMINCLEYVFRENGPFWKEHRYDIFDNASKKSGYFSYLYPIKTRKASNSIEQICDTIYDLVCDQYPEVKEECQYVEWWVHLRPHSNGHQLHFDSDETAIENGILPSPSHPIVSSVLYVSDTTGGPTIVTDQVLKPNAKLASQGWLIPPKKNRLVTFDAQYLHGVVPARGFPPNPSDRRLTFMVGFWRDIRAVPRGVDTPGPGQPFPDPKDSKYSWIHELSMMEVKSLQSEDSRESSSDLLPVHITKIWEPVETSKASSSSSSSSSRSSISNMPDYNKCFQGF